MPAPPPATPLPRHPAFTASAAAGVVGVVLLLLGGLFSSDALLIAGVVAGGVSLVAALVWRADLVASWHGKRQE